MASHPLLNLGNMLRKQFRYPLPLYVLYVGVTIGCKLVHKLLTFFKDAVVVMLTILVSLARRWLVVVDPSYSDHPFAFKNQFTCELLGLNPN
jgi:hypothetical protein